jgi:hypothetical protein
MESLLPLITGGSGALVVLALWVYSFYTGKIHSHSEFSKFVQENDALRGAYDRLAETIRTERAAANESAQAGQVTNQLIHALTDLATDRASHARREVTGPPDPGLTAEDLGL